MEDYGLVSIITPNYNCGRFIAETIESVQAQSYQNWEMLIQDDCSSDDSIKVAKEYAIKDDRIKIEINPKNSGAAISRNNAIKRAQGKWIAFLDSDDLWAPNKLERQLKWMLDNDCDFSFTQYEHIDEENNPLMVRAKAKSHISYNQMLWHCWTGCLTVVYKQDDEKIYGPDVKNNNDYALFLKVLKNKHNAMGLHECLAFYRIRKKSISRSKLHKVKPFIKVLHKYEGKNLPMCYLYLASNILIKILYKYDRLKISTYPNSKIK